MAFNEKDFLKELETVVNIDSHSKMPEGTAKVAEYIEERLQKAGWLTEKISVGPEVGPCLKAVNKPCEKYDVMLIGHMDTVFPAGTAAQRPFAVKDGHFTGPGSADMKGGLMYMCSLAEYVAEENLDGSICLLFNSDEEISSVASRPVIEREAVKAANVLVLEPARASGALVNKRKGIVKYELTFNGIAAHAGVDPDKGASAINEFIRWGAEIIKLAAPEKGTTVNIGLVNGGTGANVVAEKAVCSIDIRITDIKEAERIDKKLKEMQAAPFDSRVKIDISGGLKRPPFNTTEASRKLCAVVDEAAAELGLALEWVATGGGSDGNFTSALGVPTVDGMGPIGGGAHSDREYGEVVSIVPRFNLLTAVIKKLVQK